jgi:TonB family protein
LAQSGTTSKAQWSLGHCVRRDRHQPCPNGQVIGCLVTWPSARAFGQFVTLSQAGAQNSLSGMSPRSLLFSSNEETSRQLRQALEELELQVEHCPEIFSAVEKLTGQAFEVIAVDWDEGAEASFLLKTARELKSNQAAVTIAIVNDGASFPAAVFGVNVVLRKPVVSDEIKYSLLTCDEFLAHMRTWLVPEATTANQATLPVAQENRRWPVVQAGELAAEPLAADPLGPFPISSYSLTEDNPYDDDEAELFSQSGIQSLFHCARKFGAARKPRDISRFILVAAACVAFLAAGYAFSQPTGHNPVALALVKTYDRTVQRASKWMHGPAQDDADDGSANDEEAANYDQPNPPRNHRITRIRVVPARSVVGAQTNTAGLVMQASSDTQPVEAQPEPTQDQASPLTTPLGVPESLKTPPLQHRSDDPAPNVSISSRLVGVLQPVSLTQDLADQLLLEKVVPSYPLRALQARLQGPVVLEAWIGTDGAIRELKLVRGSLLLGKAACDAVKRWRYKPYLLDGKAVEAQTFVTVDFRLPAEMEAVQR